MLSKKEYQQKYYWENQEREKKRVRDYMEQHRDERRIYQNKYNLLNKKRKSEWDRRDSGLYIIFNGINSRCNYRSHKAYKNYGGKGIKVLWTSYQDFKRDMYESYIEHLNKYGKKQTTIDRIDSCKDYSKENCRWSTRKEQNRNMKSNLIYKGECALDASLRLGGNKNLVANRIAKGWSLKEAFNISIIKEKGIKKVALAKTNAVLNI